MGNDDDSTDEPRLEAAEVRRRLGISTATYYRWLRSGQLRGRKVGGRWRFAASEVDGLLAEGDASRAGGQRDAIREAARTAAARLAELRRRRGNSTIEPTSTSSTEKDTSMNAAADVETLVDHLLEHALECRVSDLHLHPLADGVAVRERVDGNLIDVEPALPLATLEPLDRTLRDRAGLGEAPTAHGFFLVEHAGRYVDMRVSTYPTTLGPSIAVRIVDPQAVTDRMDESGFSERLLADVRETISARSGVFIVNGPTGSGKSTTLYGLLREIAGTGVKVMTAEDPVEHHIDGLLQAAVDDSLDFADALRAMLRSDVDVGMLSELRDAETIQLLFQAGRTGRRMFSALHAPDAATAIHRLVEAGDLEPSTLLENLLGVLDQRLVGRSCPDCREMRVADEALVIALRDPELAHVPVAVNRGCESCRNTGLRGRLAIGELTRVAGPLRLALESENVTLDQLKDALDDSDSPRRRMDDEINDHVRNGVVNSREAIRFLDEYRSL